MYLWSLEWLVFLVMWHHKVIMAMALDYVVWVRKGGTNASSLFGFEQCHTTWRMGSWRSANTISATLFFLNWNSWFSFCLSLQHSRWRHQGEPQGLDRFQERTCRPQGRGFRGLRAPQEGLLRRPQRPVRTLTLPHSTTTTQFLTTVTSITTTTSKAALSGCCQDVHDSRDTKTTLNCHWLKQPCS